MTNDEAADLLNIPVRDLMICVLYLYGDEIVGKPNIDRMFDRIKESDRSWRWAARVQGTEIDELVSNLEAWGFISEIHIGPKYPVYRLDRKALASCVDKEGMIVGHAGPLMAATDLLKR